MYEEEDVNVYHYCGLYQNAGSLTWGSGGVQPSALLFTNSAVVSVNREEL